MGWVWTLMLGLSVLFAAATGRTGAVGTAASEGAAAAVRLALEIGGSVMLWSAVMEVMDRSGVTRILGRLLRPVLRLLFPSCRQDRQLEEALSVNCSANLLGLGNAATPAGIRAARRLRDLAGSDAASDELCRLVVLNTASIQLLPTTAAALRASAGAAAPFDILPAVWLASIFSVTVGLLSERGLAIRD